MMSFKELNFSRLVEFSKTDVDTSFLIRFNIQTLAGKQVYAKINLLESKQPIITEVYKLGASAGLKKKRSLIVLEGTQSTPAIPGEFELSQNYPNPFNATTTIKYALAADVNVKIEIYNIVGEKVCTLIDEKQHSGYYETTWDAVKYSSGIYFIHIRAGEFRDIKKMIIIK